ncbi:porin [Cupriavidus sp. WKF15]|uniref:porin n=1 Tax=Cupriavidus sp. WKF15 TaxID=3032282 RepID=UPI0023E0BA25|nr:porin [Cupriavidus sp. WKF15]WER46524.1 porin [Cupriavidus sp. WKF15]
MKTRIKCTALAALSACAAGVHAQSSLTLYGTIDAGIQYVSKVGTLGPTGAVGEPSGSRIGLTPDGGLLASRWGIRGSEDLGGGSKAIFVLQSAFESATGKFAISSSNPFNQIAMVGLSNSQLGQVTFGRQTTSLSDALPNFMPLRLAPAFEPGLWALGINYRENNMLKYTGTFGPVQAVAHYSFGTGTPVQVVGSIPLYNGGAGEAPGHAKYNTAYGAALSWERAGFGAMVAYDHWNPTAPNPSPTPDAPGRTGMERKVAAAVSYAKGPVKVFGGYRWRKSDFANGASLQRDNLWYAGVAYQATAALGIFAGYYYADIREGRPFAATGSASPGTNPANPQQYSLMVDYNLSKRTDVYASVDYARNGSLSFDGPFTGFLYTYNQVPGQKSMTGVAMGVRHTF